MKNLKDKYIRNLGMFLINDKLNLEDFIKHELHLNDPRKNSIFGRLAEIICSLW